MPDSGTKRSDSIISARNSVRYRVLAGLVVIMAAFAGLTIYSIVLHTRTVTKLGLINTSYLPLTHGTAEIRATQLVFNTLMDRLPDDPNQSATREWIDAARRFRPSTLKGLVDLVGETLNREVPEDEAAFLAEMRSRLAEMEKRYRENENQFQQLYDLMDTGRNDDARVHIEGLKRSERLLYAVLVGIEDDIKRHITDLAEEGERDGLRATWVLALMTLAALIAAGAVVVATNRLLSPLKTLGRAVEQVTKGDLGARLDIGQQDEIGALAAGFNRMTEALVERDQMLIRSERLATAGKMAAQVTHEIRNPLSSLGLNAELLEEELAANRNLEEASNLLRAMQDEITRLTGITESYLHFARLPSPEPTFDDLNATVQMAIDFMGGDISKRSIAVETDLHEGLGPALFDRRQIRQALANLLLNACEAMPDGGSILVSTRKAVDMIELVVADTGGGIPEESREQIFESFFSTKRRGTGLGLPLVRQICRAHGGDIRLESTGASGSRFVVSLPGTRSVEQMKA